VLKNQRLIGAIFVVMSSLGFSIGPTLAKNAYDAGANPLGVMTVRFTISSLIMLVVHQIATRKEPFPSTSPLGDGTTHFFTALTFSSLDVGCSVELSR
jgi:drug/metabolite transporter (DMT)-like permease